MGSASLPRGGSGRALAPDARGSWPPGSERREGEARGGGPGPGEPAGGTGDATRRADEVAEQADEPESGVEATLAAERRAGELGVDLSQVRGTGSGGRITVKDVQSAAKDR